MTSTPPDHVFLCHSLLLHRNDFIFKVNLKDVNSHLTLSFLFVCVSECPRESVERAMAGPELLLDSNIRLWVVLPIVFITFMVGVIRHYVTQLLHSDKKVDLEQLSDRSD